MVDECGERRFHLSACVAILSSLRVFSNSIIFATPSSTPGDPLHTWTVTTLALKVSKQCYAMDHPEYYCNNHIEEALAHVCVCPIMIAIMGQWGSMKQAGRGMPVVATAVGNYTFRFWWREWGRESGEKGCLSISQYDQCMWGNWEST